MRIMTAKETEARARQLATAFHDAMRRMEAQAMASHALDNHEAASDYAKAMAKARDVGMLFDSWALETELRDGEDPRTTRGE